MGRKLYCACLFVLLYFFATFEFREQASFYEISLHLGVATGIFYIFAVGEIGTDFGLSLGKLVDTFTDREHYTAFEYACQRKYKFIAYLFTYPTFLIFYYLHGVYCMKTDQPRFPFPFDYQFGVFSHIFMVIVAFLIPITAHFAMKVSGDEELMKFYHDHPHSRLEIGNLNRPDIIRVGATNTQTGYFSRQYFAYVSDFRVVVAPLDHIRLDVAHMRTLPGMEEATYFVKITFVEPWIRPITLPIGQQYFNNVRERLHIHVPPNMHAPPTLMERVTERFVEQIIRTQAPPVRVSITKREECFGCGTMEDLVILRVGCTPSLQILIDEEDALNGRPVIARCSPCLCNPLWCLPCMGRVFLQRNLHGINPDNIIGRSQCPTCRKTYCIADVRLVEWDDEDDIRDDIDVHNAIEAADSDSQNSDSEDDDDDFDNDFRNEREEALMFLGPEENF